LDWVTLAFLVSALIAALEVVSIIVVRQDIKSYKNDLEERGDFGDQLDRWLMSTDSEEEGAPTRLEAFTTLIGQVFYRSTHMADLQTKSVDARIENKYNAATEEALKRKAPIMWKFIVKAADYLGFNIDDIVEAGELQPFINSLRKYEIPLMTEGEFKTEGSKNWKLR